MTRNHQNPPRYFPPENGRYEVKPGLHPFGTSFGNGPADNQVFQIDRQFNTYRHGKRAAREERLEKYVQRSNLSQSVERAVCLFILHRLVAEHPTLFSFDPSNGSFRAHLTGETLRFGASGDFIDAQSDIHPPFASGIDALACQVQEDLAVISTKDADHWLSAIHLCFPNHWAAEDKIGKSFSGIHEPVAGIGPINQRADRFVRTMIETAGGLVRFAWGIATDNELNHHPHPPNERTTARNFDTAHPGAFLRIERQTIWGLPAVGASLFTIRTSFIDCVDLQAMERIALVSAVRSMSPESLRYKGIEPYQADLLRWIEAGCPQT